MGRTDLGKESGNNLVIGAGKENGKIVSTNLTSLETKILFVCKLRILYPFLPKGYPKNTPGIALGASLSLPWERVEAKHKHPKTFKEE